MGIGNGPFAVVPYLRMFTGLWGGVREPIHNPVLAIWAETGLPGILLYLCVLGSSVWLFIQEYFQHKSRDLRSLTLYFALVSSVFVGFMFSWIKGGGLEYHFTYFLMLALMLIPSCLDIKMDGIMESDVLDAGKDKT